MNKADIVDVLEEIAVLLELKGENPFKIRAYQNGARILETLEDDLDVLIEEKRLGDIKGMGDALVTKIETLHATGDLEFYSKLKASVPSGLLEMLDIPGLGGKKIKKLYDELGVEDIEGLKSAAEDGRIAGLKGFGKKTAENVLSGIQNREAYAARHHWWSVREVVETILGGLKSLEEVHQAEAAGSYRRYKETVGDLDFIVGSNSPEPIMDWFTNQEEVVEVTAKGETKSSVRLEGGLQADLRVVPPDQYAFALHHFTGSKEHNVLMRQRALARGLSLSEWGLSRKAEAGSQKSESRKEEPDAVELSAPSPPSIRTEHDLFEALDLQFIPPEFREGLDEIQAGEQEGDAFPEPLTMSDLKGVFHNHTTASDGRNSLEEMVQAAQDRGWDYLGIADHSKASFQANGLDEDRLRKQIQQIRELNASGQFSCHVFAGNEVDILADGSLDFDNDLLEALDYVVASVHSSFSLSEVDQTKRIIKAIEHPQVTMLGHLTGRLLLRREAYAVDINAIVDAAAANNTVIELNANPYRLDMDWRHWKRAAEKGVLCAINPDAHSTDGFDYTEAGVYIARKGWLTRDHILNCRPLDAVKTYFSA